MGISDLLERIALEAEVMELKANPNRRAKGAVVEARLDKGQGPVATLLVQNGTLRRGDCLIAGTAVGHVRTMRNDKGQDISEAGPSMPVEITGLTEVPTAGDIFEAVEDERLARELADKRTNEAKEKQFAAYTKVTLDNLFDQMAQNDMKELPIVVKADVQGSAEAIKQSLEKNLQRGSPRARHPCGRRRHQQVRRQPGRRLQRDHHRLQRPPRRGRQGRGRADRRGDAHVPRESMTRSTTSPTP